MHIFEHSRARTDLKIVKWILKNMSKEINDICDGGVAVYAIVLSAEIKIVLSAERLKLESMVSA